MPPSPTLPSTQQTAPGPMVMERTTSGLYIMRTPTATEAPRGQQRGIPTMLMTSGRPIAHPHKKARTRSRQHMSGKKKR